MIKIKATVVTSSNEEHVENLTEAQALLKDSIDLLQHVARATNNVQAQKYLVDRLKILAGVGHGLLSNDFNIDNWIEELEEEDA